MIPRISTPILALAIIGAASVATATAVFFQQPNSLTITQAVAQTAPTTEQTAALNGAQVSSQTTTQAAGPVVLPPIGTPGQPAPGATATAAPTTVAQGPQNPTVINPNAPAAAGTPIAPQATQDAATSAATPPIAQTNGQSTVARSAQPTSSTAAPSIRTRVASFLRNMCP